MEVNKKEVINEDATEVQDKDFFQEPEGLPVISEHALQELLDEIAIEDQAQFGEVKKNQFERKSISSSVLEQVMSPLAFERSFSEVETEETNEELLEHSIISEKEEEEKEVIIKQDDENIKWKEQETPSNMSETAVDINKLMNDITTNELQEIDEAEIEEEFISPEELSEEEDQNIVQFLKELDEILGYPDIPDEPPEEKRKRYMTILKELDDQDKEIDDLLNQLENDDNMLQVMDVALEPMMSYYEKVINLFEKVDTSFLEGTDELEGADDEKMERAKEMAREVLEAEEVDSLESSDKESSDEDLMTKISIVEKDIASLDAERKKKEEATIKKQVISKTKKWSPTKKGRQSKGKAGAKAPKKGKK